MDHKPLPEKVSLHVFDGFTRGTTPPFEGEDDPCKGEAVITSLQSGRVLLGSDGKIYAHLGSGGYIRNKVLMPSELGITTGIVGTAVLICASGDIISVLEIKETGGASSFEFQLQTVSGTPTTVESEIITVYPNLTAGNNSLNPSGSCCMPGPIYAVRLGGTGTGKIVYSKQSLVAIS